MVAMSSNSEFSSFPPPLSGAFQEEEVRHQYHPQPLAAVAYDYEFDYDGDDYEDGGYDDGNGAYPQHTYYHGNALTGGGFNVVNVVDGDGNSNMDHAFLASRIGGGGGGGGSMYHNHGIYPPPSRHNHSQTASYHRKSGGGGGGDGTGRHRCPKCGTTVTFRSDLEDNTFYCASCSGWFVANPNNIEAGHNKNNNNGGESGYEEFLAKNSGQKKVTFAGNNGGNNNEILMRHVSLGFV